MKRCPDCDFIHEDDERLCAMDGAVLVNHSGPLPFAENVLPQTLLPRNSHGRSLTLIAAGIILAVAVFLNFNNVAKRTAFQRNLQGTAQTYVGSRPSDKNPVIEIPITTSIPVPLDSPSPSSASKKAKAATNASNDWASDRDRFRAVPVASPTALSRPSPSFAPARATTSTLSNSSVTSTSRGNVTTMESRPPVKSEKQANTTVENQKKESKINSFLKKTARALKKPFKH